MRTNLAERLGYEPEEETRERQEGLLEADKHACPPPFCSPARRLPRYEGRVFGLLKLGGAAFVLAVIAGYAEMTDACVATGAIALGLTTYGIL